MSKNFGIGKESVYGTKVAPEIWLECLGENLALKPQYQPVETIRSPVVRAANLGSVHVDGSARFAANYQDIAHLFYYLLGDVSGAAPTYTIPHATTPAFLRPSLTLEVQRDPDDGGETWKYLGMVMTALGLSVAVDEVAEVTTEFFGSGEVREAGNSPTYPAFDLVTPTDCTVSIDGTAVDVERFSFNLGWPVDRPVKMGSTTLARKPKDSGTMQISGAFTLLGHNATQYAKFAAFSSVDLQFIAALAGAAPETLTLNFNVAKLNLATPALDGRAYPKPVYEFSAVLDAAIGSAIQAVVTNDETAIP